MKTYYMYRNAPRDYEHTIEIQGVCYNLYITDKKYDSKDEPKILFMSSNRITKNIKPTSCKWVSDNDASNTILETDIFLREVTEEELMLIML